MTDPPPADAPTEDLQAARPYSPGLEGVIAGETSLSFVDGAAGRLLYRGYRIGDLVDRGHLRLDRASSCGPATGIRPSGSRPRPSRKPSWTSCGHCPPRQADGRAPDGGVGLGRDPGPALATDRRAGTGPHRVLAVGAGGLRPAARRARSRSSPIPILDLTAGFLYQLTGERPDASTARALDAYFIVGAEHSFNASTFAARVITSTRSDIASAVVGAIGTMKGPLHGGAPSEVVDQLAQVGSADHAEAWIRDALDRGERLMGFGHRVYRAYDPRAAALRKVAEGMEHKPDWLQLATEVEDVALRVLAEKHPERAAEDERGVLRGAGPHGRRADVRTCSRPRSRWPATPAGPPMSWSRRPTTGSSART